MSSPDNVNVAGKGKATGKVIDLAGAKTPAPIDIESEAMEASRAKPLALRYADLQALAPPRWIMKGLLPAEGVAAVYGASASGKTFLSLDMGLHVAQGRNWFDHRVPKPVGVAYVALEAGAGIRRRLQAWGSAGGLTRKVPDNFVAYLGYPLDLSDPDNVAALADDIVAELGHGALVIVDTLARASHGLEENSATDMGVAVKGMSDLQRRVGGLVLAVHHSGKDAAKGMRGSSSLFAAMDAVISVDRWETPSGETLRQWKVAKSKDGEDGGGRMFALGVADLGVDEDGDAITSCYVTCDESPQAALAQYEGRKSGARSMGGRQLVVLHAVTSTLTERGGMGLQWEDVVEVASEALKLHGVAKDRARSAARKNLGEVIERGQLRQVGDLVSLPKNEAKT